VTEFVKLLERAGALRSTRRWHGSHESGGEKLMTHFRHATIDPATSEVVAEVID